MKVAVGVRKRAVRGGVKSWLDLGIIIIVCEIA
jgi:hypothetical protein